MRMRVYRSRFNSALADALSTGGNEEKGRAVSAPFLASAFTYINLLADLAMPAS